MSARPKSVQAKSAEPKPLEKPSLTLKRRLTAPPSKVFAAWTDPEKLAQWFGPADTVAGSASAELDVRVGGRFRVRFSTTNGEQHEVGGVYREVTRTNSWCSPGRGARRRSANRSCRSRCGRMARRRC